MSDERLPVIIRPNGKPYRPRSVKAHSWDNEEDQGPGADCGVVVLGTHDVVRAQPLAERACDAWFGVKHAITPEIGWFRRAYHGWMRDTKRGAAGVMFTASDDPKEGGVS